MKIVNKSINLKKILINSVLFLNINKRLFNGSKQVELLLKLMKGICKLKNCKT